MHVRREVPRTDERQGVGVELFTDAPAHEASLGASLARHDFDQAQPEAYLKAVLADMAAEIEVYGRRNLADREAALAASDTLAGRDLVKRARLAQLVEEALTERLGDPLRAAVLTGVGFTVFFAALARWQREGGALDDWIAAASRQALWP